MTGAGQSSPIRMPPGWDGAVCVTPSSCYHLRYKSGCVARVPSKAKATQGAVHGIFIQCVAVVDFWTTRNSVSLRIAWKWAQKSAGRWSSRG